VRRPLSPGDLSHRRSSRPLGGVLPIIGVIFGLGLLAGAILHPPAGVDPFATATHERGAFSWSRYRLADFNPQASYQAEVLRVIDGDTFEARVRIWSGFAITTKVRLRAIDAPELHARCAREYLKAEAARTALQRLLSIGAVTLSQVAPDKYRGRIDATVATRDTPDVSAALLKGGFARSYDGGRREPWC
jgi:endonuclease YncB( thermonuclease family)